MKKRTWSRSVRRFRLKRGAFDANHLQVDRIGLRCGIHRIFKLPLAVYLHVPMRKQMTGLKETISVEVEKNHPNVKQVQNRESSRMQSPRRDI